MEFLPGMRSSLLFWNSISLETCELIIGSDGTLKAWLASCLVGTQYLIPSLFHWLLCLTLDDECICWMLSNVDGKNAWKIRKKFNRIGSETSMKKHWKKLLAKCQISHRKKNSAMFGSDPCFATNENDDENCQHFPLFFHALIKKEGEVLISLHEFRYCKILWQPLLFLILLRLLLFWGTEWCKKFFLLWKTFVSSKKRKLFVLKRVAIICQLQIKLWYVPLCIYCIIETRVDDPAVVNFFLLWPNH